MYVNTNIISQYTHTHTWVRLRFIPSGPFPFGGGGGAQHFLPEFLIFARKVECVFGNAFLPHMGRGGGGSIKESSSFEVIEYGTPHRGGGCGTVGTFWKFEDEKPGLFTSNLAQNVNNYDCTRGGGGGGTVYVVKYNVLDTNGEGVGWVSPPTGTFWKVGY